MFAKMQNGSDKKTISFVERVYDEYGSDMLRFAAFRLRKAGVCDAARYAEDAVQNAFLKMIRYSHSVKDDIPSAKVKGYVFTVLSNEINTLLRGMKEYEDISARWDIADEENDLSSVAEQTEGDIVTEIMKLGEKYRAVLFLRYSMEMTVNEIAATLGIPQKTVYSRLERAIKKLRT